MISEFNPFSALRMQSKQSEATENFHTARNSISQMTKARIQGYNELKYQKSKDE